MRWRSLTLLRVCAEVGEPRRRSKSVMATFFLSACLDDSETAGAGHRGGCLCLQRRKLAATRRRLRSNTHAADLPQAWHHMSRGQTHFCRCGVARLRNSGNLRNESYRPRGDNSVMSANRRSLIALRISRLKFGKRLCQTATQLWPKPRIGAPTR